MDVFPLSATEVKLLRVLRKQRKTVKDLEILSEITQEQMDVFTAKMKQLVKDIDANAAWKAKALQKLGKKR